MAAFTVSSSGDCSKCKKKVNEETILKCHECKTIFHAFCGDEKPWTNNKAFVANFNKQKARNFIFMCDVCLTKKENSEASTLQDQIESLTATVSTLVQEFKKFKANPELRAQPATATPQTVEGEPAAKQMAWTDAVRTKEVVQTKDKVTVCIKSGGSKVDMSKVKAVVTENGIQISKSSVNHKNGDVYVELPSGEERDKLVPLLTNTAIPGNTVVNVKSKCPVITIRNVLNFESEENFIEKVKTQNRLIGEKFAEGAEFSIVFSKEHEMRPGFGRDLEGENNTVHQIVARVSEGIREAIKAAGDKIFVGLSSHRVFDRFYVKSCAQCHRFGHYHAQCQASACCGYCGAENHTSRDCPIHQSKEQDKYSCVNCKDAGKPHEGHSSHWPKCPTYLEQQKKMMMNVPYYAKNCC